VSPRSLVNAGDWVTAGRELIRLGQIPADVSLIALGERVAATVGGARMSTGSFYSHFHGVAQYYAALIDDWSAASLAEILPPGEARAVRDPHDKLRLIRSRWVAAAGPGGAMRRWAGRAGLPQRTDAERDAATAAAAAVTAVDRAVGEHVRRALEDFGLAGEYPAVVADVMVTSWAGDYHATAPAAAGAAAAEAEAERKFDVFLDFIADAGGRRGAEVAMAAGDAPAEVLLYMLARGLPEGRQQELLAQAQEFRDSQAQAPDQPGAAEDPPDGGTLPAADVSQRAG
jgi:hypothetical protein